MNVLAQWAGIGAALATVAIVAFQLRTGIRRRAEEDERERLEIDGRGYARGVADCEIKLQQLRSELRQAREERDLARADLRDARADLRDLRNWRRRD